MAVPHAHGSISRGGARAAGAAAGPASGYISRCDAARGKSIHKAITTTESKQSNNQRSQVQPSSLQTLDKESLKPANMNAFNAAILASSAAFGMLSAVSAQPVSQPSLLVPNTDPLANAAASQPQPQQQQQPSLLGTNVALTTTGATAAGAGQQSFWRGPIQFVNKVPKESECAQETATVSVFWPGYGQKAMNTGDSLTVGPFSDLWYNLGVQENVYQPCSYVGEGNNTCHYDGGKVDQPCYNFNVDANCVVTQNVCPFPAPSAGHTDSPAPNGALRYSITGNIENINSVNTCVLTVAWLATRTSVTAGCLPTL